LEIKDATAKRHTCTGIREKYYYIIKENRHTNYQNMHNIVLGSTFKIKSIKYDSEM